MVEISRSPTRSFPAPEGETPLIFTSLGVLFLDDFQFWDGSTLTNVPGGSGFFSTLGARLAIGEADARRIGFVVRAGRDFPPAVRRQLGDWEISALILDEPENLTSRSVNKFRDPKNQERTFLCPNPPLQPTVAHITSSPLPHSSAFHMLGPPSLIQSLASDLVAAREAAGNTSRPLLVWEPLPGECVREHLDTHARAMKLVDVFSPNHHELRALCGAVPEKEASFSPGEIEEFARGISVGPGGSGYVLVRCAEHGCVVLGRDLPPRWFPAYWGREKEITDVTGCGNVFLGAFVVGWQRAGGQQTVEDRVTEACVRGSAAASFVLEQFGPPKRSIDQGGVERWNGDSVEERVARYRKKIGVACEGSMHANSSLSR